MSSPYPDLVTERLRLRAWRPEDREPFAALNADPEVMQFLPKLLSREESDARADSIAAHFARHGFGLWAVERSSSGEFLGFTGLNVPEFATHFTPCVEMGWRLARGAWGHGYATEAARRAMTYAFDELGVETLFAFTVPDNVRSRRVMERIGMEQVRDGDFDHPLLPEGHRLRRHVLYRASSVSDR